MPLTRLKSVSRKALRDLPAEQERIGGNVNESGRDKAKDNSLYILDAETLKEVYVISKHSGSVNCAAYSPDGKRIVSASDDQTARIWSTETKEELFSLKLYGAITSVTFSPDGKHVLATDKIKNVGIWDATTGEMSHILNGHFYEVTSCAYSPDGRHATTGSLDFTIRFWDTQTGKPNFDRTFKFCECRKIRP